MTQTQKAIIAKQQSHAFGKDVYLLGRDTEGINYWLEAPKWDCGWYWGFGYIETYQNNRKPSSARDIDSHSHIKSSFLGKIDQTKDYVHNLFDCPVFAATTFTESEGWTLAELFNTFYTLSESAEMFGRGGSHTASNPCKDVLTNTEWTKHINEVMIPAVTAKIIEILSPKLK
jgi:hypothetical protein